MKTGCSGSTGVKNEGNLTHSPSEGELCTVSRLLESSCGTLDRTEVKSADGRVECLAPTGTSCRSLGDGGQQYCALAVVVHDVVQVFIPQVH